MRFASLFASFETGQNLYYTRAPNFGQFWGDLPVLKRGWPTIWPALFVAISTFIPPFCQFASFVLITRS